MYEIITWNEELQHVADQPEAKNQVPDRRSRVVPVAEPIDLTNQHPKHADSKGQSPSWAKTS